MPFGNRKGRMAKQMNALMFLKNKSGNNISISKKNAGSGTHSGKSARKEKS
jgi:hypothetical protein